MSAPRYFLRQIYAERYGAFARREMGPFTAGLNVVFGSNEAGKSTFASLIGGVLFGWEDARGVQNTYRPAEGTRSGMLTFQLRDEDDAADVADAGAPAASATTGTGAGIGTGIGAAAEQSLVRIVRVGDERQGVVESPLVGDIDAATYRSMFAFSADELRSLQGSSNLTARLLSAGSGTAASPSSVYVALEQRIAHATSHTPEAQDSVPIMTQQLDELRALVQEETQRVEAWKQNARELRELQSNREDVSAHLTELDQQLEQLSQARKELEANDEHAAALEAELAELTAELNDAQNRARHMSAQASAIDEYLLRLETTDERALRERIIQLIEQKEALDRQVESATQNSQASLARYEAIVELDEAALTEAAADDFAPVPTLSTATPIPPMPAPAPPAPPAPAPAPPMPAPAPLAPAPVPTAASAPTPVPPAPVLAKRRPRHAGRIASRLAFSIVPCIIFIAGGIALFIYGRHINSLSFTVLGLTLIGLSFVLGLTAVVTLRATTSVDDTLKKRIKDSQWVMLQDKKRLDSCIMQQRELAETITAFLAREHLTAAQGSLRQALGILDDARTQRAEILARSQRAEALELRAHAIEQELTQLRARRDQLIHELQSHELQLPSDVQLFHIDELIHQKTAQRTALREVADQANHRIGKLSQLLEQAAEDTRLDQLKLQAELVRTRLRDAKRQLVGLLLARRMLERAMAAWELDAQPRVYEEAGRLLALITDGRWVGVSVSSSGSIVATSREGEEVMPRHLSLGTCQQLYLALRIALLLTAQDVGACVPVVADDILVHFDEQRRTGAARALAQLAQRRQVIIFTCHRETALALREASSEVNYLEIG